MAMVDVTQVQSYLANVLASEHTLNQALLPSVPEVLDQMRRIFSTEFAGMTLEQSLFNELKRDDTSSTMLKEVS